MFQRHRLLRALLSFAVLTAFVGHATADEKTYEDKTHHFHLSYPDSLAPDTPPKPTVLLFLTPKDLKPDAQMRQSVQVKIESGSALPGVSLDRVVDGFSKSMTSHGIVITETRDAQISGRPAKRLTYKQTLRIDNHDVEVAAFLYLFIVDDWTWSIDVRSPAADAAPFAPVGEQVAKSFQLDNKT
jgi:hypothetical protein